MLKRWFLTHVSMRNYTVSSLVMLDLRLYTGQSAWADLEKNFRGGEPNIVGIKLAQLKLMFYLNYS